MNLSLFDVGGDARGAQFTLLGDCRKGKRPSFTCAAKPEEADRLYRLFVEACRNKEYIRRRSLPGGNAGPNRKPWTGDADIDSRKLF